MSAKRKTNIRFPGSGWKHSGKTQRRGLSRLSKRLVDSVMEVWSNDHRLNFATVGESKTLDASNEALLSLGCFLQMSLGCFK